MLKHLEDLSQDIISDFSDMKKRANDMRNTNGTFYTDVHYIYILLKLLIYFLQNQQTREYFTSACSACFVY